MFPEGDIADAQRGYRRIGTIGVELFLSGAVRAASYEFPPASEEDPRLEPRVRTCIMLPRPGLPARGHYRSNELRTGVPRRVHCIPKCPTRLPTGWHRRFLAIFRAPLEQILAFSANERRGPASCSRGLVLPQGDTAEPMCRGLVFPDEDIAGPHSNTCFNPSLEYSTDRVLLFWQPPSYCSHWSPSSFFVDDESNSCAEQCMMATKFSLFQDHR